jgi:hypothetical protein
MNQAIWLCVTFGGRTSAHGFLDIGRVAHFSSEEKKLQNSSACSNATWSCSEAVWRTGIMICMLH